MTAAGCPCHDTLWLGLRVRCCSNGAAWHEKILYVHVFDCLFVVSSSLAPAPAPVIEPFMHS